MKYTFLKDSPVQDFNDETLETSDQSIREKDKQSARQHGTGKGLSRILIRLQKARSGKSKLVDPVKSQEIIDAYFFGPSNKATKRLYHRSLAEARKRKKDEWTRLSALASARNTQLLS